MLDSGIELAIGESVRMADQILTVLDIQGNEIIFRLDQADDDVAGHCDQDWADQDGASLQLPPR